MVGPPWSEHIPPGRLHGAAAEKVAHEQMGFYQGWGESLDRLALLVSQGVLD